MGKLIPVRAATDRGAWRLAAAATAVFALALSLAGLGLPEYAHAIHPVGLRGASGLPGAWLFDLGAFVLPAILLLWSSRTFRVALAGAGWPARIGLVLVQLSALAFGAQGLLPMDASDLEASATRLHVLAWMLWWIAFVPGALLLASGARRGPAFAVASVLAGLLVPYLAVLAPIGPWVGLAQRLAFGLWFGWWMLAAWRSARAA
ncbi:MAG: DUF998 domain-containing protein [Lysobacteraceae bacterium]|nr:MAG: DUF998 domain-containing protein [Xanthomonadaceae bacterium]